MCKENLGILRATTDARGRQLEVVEIQAPTQTHADDDIVDWSYINHYVCNGAVILCSFDDPRDEEAADTLGKSVPRSRGGVGRGPPDLRMRRRHPLHHPATAGGLIPLAVVVDRGELPTEGRDDDGCREEVGRHENGCRGGVVGSGDRWDE